MRYLLVVAVAGAWLCGVGCGDDREAIQVVTTLDSAPPAQSSSRTATFVFHADGATGFRCALDGAAAVPCSSPYTITVDEGAHTLVIAALDGADPAADPVVVTWTVDLTPPDTAITHGPAPFDNSLTTSFSFVGVPAADTARFNCSLDGAPFTTCTSPLAVTTTAGSHEFDVRAVDAAGNADPTPARLAWTIDTSMIDTTITSGPAMGSTTSGAVAFEFSSTDAAAGFDCHLDAAPFAACTSPASYVGLSDGAHVFEVRAHHGGAIDVTPAMRSWTVDATPPQVAITQGPPDGTSASATFAFSSTSADIAGFECEIDNVVAYTPCTSPWTYVVPGGFRTFHVRATDSAGNTAVATWTWLVTLPGPTVTIDGGPQGLTNNPNPTFSFTTTGAVSLIDCSMDGAPYTACASPVTYSGLNEGAHVFVVRVSDGVGSESTDSRYFTIDVTPPAASIWLSPPALGRDRHPVVGVGTDGTEYQVALHVDGVFWPTGATGDINTPSPPPHYYLVTPGPPLSDGTHMLEVLVYDQAGNRTTLTLTYTLDATGPTVSLDSTPSAVATDPTATFTFSSPDAVGFDCEVDEGPWVACTSPYTVAIADGVRTFRVRGNDALGNHTVKTYAWRNQGEPMVTTSLGGFDTGGGVVVTWNGLPGNALDWISFAPEGSNDMTVTQRVYTGGAKSGTATLPGTAGAGSYVARAYVNDTFTKLAESAPFSISTPCAGNVGGDVTIATAADVAALATYTDLNSLTIVPTASFDVTLPCLQVVAGKIELDGTGNPPITSFSAPRLQATGVLWIFDGPPRIDVPALVSITQAVHINQSPAPVIQLQRVNFTGSAIQYYGSGSLGPNAFDATTTLPATLYMDVDGFDGFNNVTSIAGIGTGTFTLRSLRFAGLNRLPTVPIALSFTGGIDGGFKSLARLSETAIFTLSSGTIATLPSLETGPGPGRLLQFKISGPGPQTLSLPVLTRAERFLIEGLNATAGLTTLDAPQLESVHYEFDVSGDLPSFLGCTARNVLDQIYPASTHPSYVGFGGGICTYNF